MSNWINWAEFRERMKALVHEYDPTARVYVEIHEVPVMRSERAVKIDVVQADNTREMHEYFTGKKWEDN